VKIALAQIDPTIGDFTGNLAKIVNVSRLAAEQGARLAVFSELCICGYLPADFLEKPSFLERCRTAVDELAAATRELPVAVLAGAASLSTGDGFCWSSTSGCCLSMTSSTSSATSARGNRRR